MTGFQAEVICTKWFFYREKINKSTERRYKLQVEIKLVCNLLP